MTERPPRKGKIYTIAGSDSFAASLAAGIKAAYGDVGNPLALARVTLLVPTRRAVLAVRKAFTDLEPSGVTLMPQILPLGDVADDDLANGNGSGEDAATGFEDLRDGLAPVIAPLKRQLLLTQLIAARSDVAGLQSVATKAALAADLIRFFDAVETEEADLARLENVVPENLATHWQATLDFLKIVTEHWPGILGELGVMDPVSRRSAVLRQLADKWAAQAPDGPVIIAGSTGSIPATQMLMGAVLAHAEGALVLPGLDLALPPRVWERVQETHPQFGLKALLKGLEVERSDVALWPTAMSVDAGLAARRSILSQAMLPADTTEGWLTFSQSDGVHKALGAAFAGLARIEADDPRLEALTIALIMRETMETPGKSVALVTPDRGLARRVSAALKRWDLEVDDSAGVPLVGTPVGSFLQGILDVVETNFAPVPLLALLKHPLTGLGLARPRLRALAARLEILCLRGVRPGSGIDGLRHRLAGKEKRSESDGVSDLETLLDGLETSFEPILTIEDDDPEALVDAHARVAEALAGSVDDNGPVNGAMRLWAGAAGETAMLFFAELLAEISALSTLAPADYPGLYRTLAQPRTVRQTRNVHPRAFIWGPLEARLQSADRIILGGLNEKVWPQAVQSDPWLSRPMRAALGMSQPERRIGQSAHDFVQLAGASDVILTRSLKVDGAPTVASRWLMRLENMLAGLEASRHLESETPWLSWARDLDVPLDYAPVSEPRPAPPLEARPRSMSVTEIETWLRDPYAIYAKRILGLRALDPLDAPVGAATRGTVVHRALERFVRAHMDGVSGADLDALIEEGRKAFEEEGVSAEVLAFWLPRFARLSRWFIGFEIAQRAQAKPIGLEVKGNMTFDGPAGPFELNARADRIDIYTDGSGAGLYDYKTGQVPSGTQVKALLAPQLPLEAMMVLAGGFEGIGKPAVREVAHLQVSGGRVPGRAIKHSKDIEELADKAAEVLENFIAIYDDPTMPYRSRVMPMFEVAEGTYDHLARVKEWSVYGNEEGGSE